MRHKACLVGQGFLQTKGVDYFHIYSPFAIINSIQVFLTILCSIRYNIRQFDVETNGDLDEIPT